MLEQNKGNVIQPDCITHESCGSLVSSYGDSLSFTDEYTSIGLAFGPLTSAPMTLLLPVLPF